MSIYYQDPCRGSAIFSAIGIGGGTDYEDRCTTTLYRCFTIYRTQSLFQRLYQDGQTR